TDLVDLEAKLDHRRMPPYDLFDAARQHVDAAHQEALAQSAAHAALGPRRTPAAGTRATFDLGQIASAVADQRRPSLSAAGDHQLAQLALVDRPIAVGLDQLEGEFVRVQVDSISCGAAPPADDTRLDQLIDVQAACPKLIRD